jgi:NAD(P)-dependent dehydrogenase (short-subunit alcohol dehydrogenase family)
MWRMHGDQQSAQQPAAQPAVTPSAMAQSIVTPSATAQSVVTPPATAQSVVITGGTKGVGAGIARAFLQAGAKVLVCGRNAPADPALLPSAGGRSALFCQADVRDPGQCSRLVRAAADLFGQLDVLVSNAGGSPEVAAAAASPRFHQKIIELNLLAPLQVAQAANAIMQNQDGGGAIIMIGSISGTRPSPGTAAYGAAKAGLHHLVTSLAIEWAPRVRLTCVAPGMVETDAAAGHYGQDGPTAAVRRTVPLQRLATPEDVAAACLFLASPQAAYVSGSTLLLHGGGEPPAFLAARDQA